MSNFLDEPELIEPINLEIESIDKGETTYSIGPGGRREPINNIVRTLFVIPAQVVFGNTEQVQHSSQLGTDEEASGYIIIRPKDLTDLGKTIKRGDRIIKFIDSNGGERVLSNPLYFVHSAGDLSSHFSGSGFSFIRALFTDRNPIG